jgi:catalase
MPDDIGQRLIAVIDESQGTRPGLRAAHAKGVCCEGTFTATQDAAALTIAPHMQGTPVPVLVRFSNAPANPDVPDYASEVAGMAVKFLLPDGRENDIVAINLPVFFVRDPEAFIELTRARRPGRKTGRPRIRRILMFALRHREAMGAVLYSARHRSRVMASRAQARYNALHSFRWTNARGSSRFVRYELHPLAGEREIPRSEARRLGRDFLREELSNRLEAGPAAYRLMLQLAGPGDRVDDPTKAWPASRPRLEAGRLEIHRFVADQDADCERRVFDPTRVIEGIQCSGDRVLAARRPAYSVSIERRLAASQPGPEQ